MSDPVNQPAHYTFGTIEVIDAIEDWALGFHLGNAVKYIARARHKGNEVQDLRKAVWYLNRYIESVCVSGASKSSSQSRESRAVERPNRSVPAAASKHRGATSTGITRERIRGSR